jgi:hypothetical protein
MIGTFTRSVLCFCAAVVLLALLLCAGEVGCRVWRLTTAWRGGVTPFSEDDLTVPSAKSWVDVHPLLDVHHLSPDGEYVRIRTNEWGLRGSMVDVPKPRGTFRILCLGGDNLFAPDLGEEQTLPMALQRYLAQHTALQVEVLNGGCPHAGPLTQLLRYKTHLSALQPDLVLLCLSVDDLQHDLDVRGALRLDHQRQPAFAAHPGALLPGFHLADAACREFVCLTWMKQWALQVVGTGARRGSQRTLEEGYGRRELGSIVSLAQIVSANYSNLIITTTPSTNGIDQVRSAMSQQRATFSDDLQRLLSEFKITDKVQVHNALGAISRLNQTQGYFSVRSGHLNSDGNDRYAQSLAKFLLEAVPDLTQVASPSGPAASPLVPVIGSQTPSSLERSLEILRQEESPLFPTSPAGFPSASNSDGPF